MRPAQWVGEVLTNRRVGAYHQMTVAAPAVVERVRPGQFVAVTVGGEQSALLSRRCFPLYATTPQGAYAGTAQFLVDVTGAGTGWLADRRPGDRVNLIGPLGSPFLLCDEPIRAVLVGGGWHAAALLPLADALHSRDCSVHFLLGASGADRIFGALEARRTGAAVTLTTEDGSAGVAGVVTDVLDEVLDRAQPDAMYACGSLDMLRAASAVAGAHHVPCQVAVSGPMVCGVGLCAGCVLPVVGDDGVTRLLRSCVEGPVFFANRVRWDATGPPPTDRRESGRTEAADA